VVRLTKLAIVFMIFLVVLLLLYLLLSKKAPEEKAKEVEKLEQTFILPFIKLNSTVLAAYSVSASKNYSVIVYNPFDKQMEVLRISAGEASLSFKLLKGSNPIEPKQYSFFILSLVCDGRQHLLAVNTSQGAYTAVLPAC